MSVGWQHGQDKLLARLLEEAARQNQIVIAAAGNGAATGPPIYPAADENVLAVTAVDAIERVASPLCR